MHESSFGRMGAFRESYLEPVRAEPLQILDVGAAIVQSDVPSYRQLFDEPPWHYVGLDIEAGLNVDVAVADPYDWREVSSGRFDVVVSGQAFEHIEWPWLTMVEIARVLKPGGIAAITAPSAGPVHRFPKDCWRFYPDGLPALAAYAGLDVLESSVDRGYAYPANAFWGDAFAVLRRPARDGLAEAEWRRRAAAARASAGREVLDSAIGAALARRDTQTISHFSAIQGLDAIPAHDAAVLRGRSQVALRRGLIGSHLRAIWHATTSPRSRLRRS